MWLPIDWQRVGRTARTVVASFSHAHRVNEFYANVALYFSLPRRLGAQVIAE